MPLIQPLMTGPLDIVGDIHGEIDALLQLLEHLGYDEQGRHKEGRRLIFVGDLCDRGPDSVAVIQKVQTLIEQGKAQCVLGNHELNLLNQYIREGNNWFYNNPNHPDTKKNFPSVTAHPEQRQAILDFFASLPLALDSNELRVVHACWHQESFDRLRQGRFTQALEAYQFFEQATEQQGQESGVIQLAEQERAQLGQDMYNEHKTPPLLLHIAQKECFEQMGNPVRVISSGTEQIAETPFFAAGKWRMTNRTPWWENYRQEIPVVTGHYWRQFDPTKQSRLFTQIKPTQWYGAKNNVFCVDYSVGKRFLDRQQNRSFTSCLAALRWPEKSLVLEDGDVLATK